jgi:glycopeptide antibiotics resistance protein
LCANTEKYASFAGDEKKRSKGCVKMENLHKGKRDTLTIALFVLYLLGLIWLILFKLQFSVPIIEQGRIANLIPFRWANTSEIKNNVLVFVPFGIYSSILKRNWPFAKKLLATVVLTLTLEIIQFAFAIGRTDITDVLSNTLGGIIGIGLHTLLLKFLKGKTNSFVNILALMFILFVIFWSISLLSRNGRWIIIR